MSELIGTVVIVIAIFSVFGLADVNLCVHTAENDYCTSAFEPRVGRSKQDWGVE